MSRLASIFNLGGSFNRYSLFGIQWLLAHALVMPPKDQLEFDS